MSEEANTNSVKEFQKQTDENAMRFIANMGIDNLPKSLRISNSECNDHDEPLPCKYCKTLEHFDNCPVYKLYDQCTCLLDNNEKVSTYWVCVCCKKQLPNNEAGNMCENCALNCDGVCKPI